jgi:type IV pilus assembly protein PilO
MALDFKDIGQLRWYYQALIVAAICGGLLAVFWYQFLTPFDSDIQARMVQLDDLKRTIAKSLVQQAQLAQLKKEAIELQKRLDMLKSVLPTERETDLLFRSVQQQATASALKINRVGPRPTIDHEVYTEWPIDMDVTGTYHNVGLFLDRIRQLSRIVNVTQLRLVVRSSEGDLAATQSVGATYVATTFVYKEEGIASSAPPPSPVK